MSAAALFAYLLVSAIIVRMLIALYEVPSAALLAELSEDYDQRTSLVVYRFFFGYVGAVMMGVIAFSIYLRPTAEQPVGMLNRAGYHGYSMAAAALIFLAILVLVTWYGVKLIYLLFMGLDAGAITVAGFDAAWAKPTYRLVRIAVIAFALVIAYPYIPGSDSQAFKGVSLLIGVVFSLGSTSLIGNMISGYSMAYRRLFKHGDRVKIGEYFGDVEEIRLMVTYLRTVKNELVAVPNSTIINSEVVNYSKLAKKEGLILHTTVGIGYQTSWRQVQAMLIRAAEITPGLMREPKPFVLKKELRDFAVIYEVNAYCDEPRAMESLYAALHANILDVFNEYGVQIMTPTYMADPPLAKIVPKDQWYTAPARPPDNQNAGGAKHEGGSVLPESS